MAKKSKTGGVREEKEVVCAHCGEVKVGMRYKCKACKGGKVCGKCIAQKKRCPSAKTP